MCVCVWGGLLKLWHYFSTHPECPIQLEILGLPGCYLLPRFQRVYERWYSWLRASWVASAAWLLGDDAYIYIYSLMPQAIVLLGWKPVHPSPKVGRTPAPKDPIKWVISLRLGKRVSQSHTVPRSKSPCWQLQEQPERSRSLLIHAQIYPPPKHTYLCTHGLPTAFGYPGLHTCVSSPNISTPCHLHEKDWAVPTGRKRIFWVSQRSDSLILQFRGRWAVGT